MIAFFSRLALAIATATLATLLITRFFLSSPPDETTLALLRGHAEHVAQRMAQTPPAERFDESEAIAKTLQYGVSLEQATGGTATRSETRRGKLYVVARVPGNPGQVVLGPLPFGYRAGLTSVLLLSLLISSLLALILSLQFFGRVKALERVARQMHKGDFDARVERDQSDALDGIAESLNELGDRVGQLLTDERDLLRTVAHEVRTPISRMHFRVESIHRKVGDSAPKEAAGLVSDLEQVDKLFEELLTYVGFDEFHQDRPELQTSTIDVAEVVTRLAKQLTVVNESIHVEIRADEGAEVLANAKLFERATSNLILNAMAYGGPTIKIDIRVFERKCVIDVQDSGPGIPELDRPKVIKPFVRLAQKKTKGTGLGLAIVSRIMQLHGGHLHIVDAPTGGASVQLVWKSAEHKRAKVRGLGSRPDL